MEQQLLNLAAGNGLWASLYVFLFIYVLYDSRHREKKYQETISENQSVIKNLTEKFGIVEIIEKDVSYIKAELRR
ncbi:BhlA/UviB family holin-like peptide [Alkaliphilus sp. B6464]|uniref:BhlA/UviB family holin-like peptide n=1 Tax=Alkaliphilus sp. B6464 TaxID=2731219 RepID=UPI001BA43EA0|nr:BhlA/UviB family holin-like peptide [Alkaliphilus sp. B6464]QUH21406.1 bacteriocin [Alkaliphilus sp. B6464]